jgi:hypothetical protein
MKEETPSRLFIWRNRMTLNEIMNIVHEAYPDGFTRNYWEAESGRPRDGNGDTLAEFIVKELAESYDASICSEEQLAQAGAILEQAHDELSRVITALQSVAMGRAI